MIDSAPRFCAPPRTSNGRGRQQLRGKETACGTLGPIHRHARLGEKNSRLNTTKSTARANRARWVCIRPAGVLHPVHVADLPNVSNAADVSNVATAALLRASRPLLHDARVHRVHMAPLGVGAPLPDLPDMSDAADVSNVADAADALQLPSPA